MIYWDNAATTWPKPPSVGTAVARALRDYGGNPGRAGHAMSLASAEQIFACRQAAARFFGLSDPARVVFTLNCTMALNTVIRGLVGEYGRVLISDIEHNAVWRPAWGLDIRRPRVDVAKWSADEEETVDNFRRAIRPDTRLIVCVHASNVFGVTLPVRRLARLAHEHGIPLCVDAAQSAGILPLDMEADGIDYLCVAAHKGLYAPMGMGLLLCRDGEKLQPLVRGGTGSGSRYPQQPQELPDRLESGTPNTPGICGLAAGLRFVEQRGRESIYQHELGLIQRLYDRLEDLNKVRLYTPRPVYGKSAPLLSMNVEGLPSEQVATMLNEQGIAVRAGLHCAPLAHGHFGTLPAGTVRLAPSAFSTAEEVEKICKVFSQIAQK
ncbi:MAG: aminotransferase class V-fold PLP-dependent enzyme [Clostridia bacterium]|nr:aminotransferase class V-fold PLP-dependent enzyme [Clostridia bacterium]